MFMSYNDSLFHLTLCESNRYASQKTNCNIHEDKVMSFLSLLYLSGYHKVPHKIARGLQMMSWEYLPSSGLCPDLIFDK